MMQMSLLALQSVTKIAGIGPLKVILCFVFQRILSNSSLLLEMEISACQERSNFPLSRRMMEGNRQ